MPILGVIASGISANITPSGYVWLGTATGNGSGTTSITNIPTSYDYLEIRATVHAAANGSDLSIVVNNDTSLSYSFHQMYMPNNSGSINGSSYQTTANDNWNPANIPSATKSSDLMSTVVMQISNSLGKWKMYQSRQGWTDAIGQNPMDGYYIVRSGQFTSTNKITSLTFGSNGSTNFGLSTTSKIDLYGIKV